MKEQINDSTRLTGITYNAEFATDANTQKAAITTTVTLEAEAKGTLFAKLKVDGHELLPISRTAYKPGSNSLDLPEVNIVRRKTADSSFDEMPSSYEMELSVSCDSRTYLVKKQLIDLNDMQ